MSFIEIDLQLNRSGEALAENADGILYAHHESKCTEINEDGSAKQENYGQGTRNVTHNMADDPPADVDRCAERLSNILNAYSGSQFVLEMKFNAKYASDIPQALYNLLSSRGERSVKVFNDAGDASNVAVLAEGILWAAGLEVPGFARNPTPAQIINVSLDAQEESDALAKAVTAAQNAGALVIAASGNDAKRDAITAPANLSNVLAVGVIDRGGVRNEFSNYARQGRSVDLMVPGGKPGLCPDATALSTFPIGVTGPPPGYGCLEGTSVAAAFVSGVAALVLSAEPNLSPQELKQRLLNSTRTQPERSRSEYGAGILCG